VLKLKECKMTNIDKAKQELEKVLKHYREGLITEQERYNLIFDILYWLLYPEQWPT